MTAKILPKNITSYDLLKAAAVILMVIDHLGAFYFPENAWLRVLGRLCVPMWFFLIGYAKSRDIGPHMWIATGILIASDFIAGLNIFSLTILTTIILVRIVINPLMNLVKSSVVRFVALIVLLLLLLPVTAPIFDYGSQGVLLAIFGYLLRNRNDNPLFEKILHPYMIFSVASFFLIQWGMFNFEAIKVIALLWGSIFVFIILLSFKPMEYKRVSEILPAPIVWIVKFMGRRTLEIYVVHLLLLKTYGMIFYPEYFNLFSWIWFPY